MRQLLLAPGNSFYSTLFLLFSLLFVLFLALFLPCALSLLAPGSYVSFVLSFIILVFFSFLAPLPPCARNVYFFIIIFVPCASSLRQEPFSVSFLFLLFFFFLAPLTHAFICTVLLKNHTVAIFVPQLTNCCHFFYLKSYRNSAHF